MEASNREGAPQPAESAPTWFERHKRITIALVLTASIAMPLLILEVGLRVAGLYDPFELSFYTVIREGEENVQITPYGEIRINSLGYADEEFDLEDPRPRVGYIGDSVVFGLGVGHGFRLSDYLRASLPEYQHFTIGESGTGVPSPDYADQVVDQLGLDKLIYFLNLNDLLPYGSEEAAAEEPSEASLLQRARNSRLFRFVDKLSTSSHAYNMFRMSLRNALIRGGYDAMRGAPAYELQPDLHPEVLEATARRVSEVNAGVTARGAQFCVVLLPYEMQVSTDAAQYYRDNGVQWEPGFTERSTQALLEERFDPELEVLDAYGAFVRQPADRDSIGLGELYVTRAGGALDWNHPNRLGHRKLADFILERRPCGL